MGGIDNALKDARDGRMGRIVQMGNPFIPPIRSHEILKQIVCADAEELHLGRQQICNEGRTRHLDHDAKFHIGLKSHALHSEFTNRFLEQSLGVKQLLPA